MTTLCEIATIAKSDPATAEQMLMDFVNQQFPDLNAQSISINSSKVSLNSVNGFIKTTESTETPAREYFFKFHAEEGECSSLAETEYYQSQELSKAGLPVIKPVYASTKPGNQFLIYEKITAPTAFEEFESLELQYLSEGKYDEEKLEKLLAAEKRLLQKQSEVFLKTLELTPTSEVAEAPINQLFYNRLVGKNGATPRLETYYLSNPDFQRLSNLKWTINGKKYKKPLTQIIKEAITNLNPTPTPPTNAIAQGPAPAAKPKPCASSTSVSTYSQRESDSPSPAPAVVGHGDGHNGNKFYIDGEFVFFDPAFAGRQPALLSFVKATAHNVFAHPFWLYDPGRMEGELKISAEISGDIIEVEHNWDMEERSPLRKMIFDLQIEYIWQPLIDELSKRELLFPNWQEYLKSALFCCPFLVYNLFNKEKYDEPQTILALSKCIELAHQDLLSLTPNP